MQRFESTLVLAAAVVALGTIGPPRISAAPAPSTYANVERAIREVEDGWSRTNAPEDPNAPGWRIYFKTIQDQLKAYSEAQTPEARIVPLNQLYQLSAALATVPWEPALTVREELRAWLNPRVQLAWAERRLSDVIESLPPTDDPAAQANRQRWNDFVVQDLAGALTKYQTAANITQRQEGLKAIHDALAALGRQNASQPWQPSNDLQTAINGLFNQPNLDITADLSIVQPVLDAPLITTGPIYRKGYWSYVTAGPKTGFGLLPSDQGIWFYNKQMLQSTTPIHDFQEQVASDPQGRRAARMYEFSATSTDWAEQSIYALLSTSGLSLTPVASHNIDAQIGSAPQRGGGLMRLVAGLVGYNQNRITNEVYQNTVREFQQRIPAEAQEEAQERIASETYQRNAEIQQFLIGNDLLAIQEFLISGLSLRSRPEAVYVGGLFQSRTGDSQRGADTPQPLRMATPDAGLTADVHISSVLTSAVDALFHRPQVQDVQNVMIVTHDVPPGTPPAQAATITTNVDFPTYLAAAEEAQKAGNPKVQAIRIRRPAQPPEFAADAQGRLVALVKDLEIDVPAPDPKSQAGSVVGAGAKVLRIKLPQTEIALSYNVTPQSAVAYHVSGKIEDISAPPTSSVIAIRDDEASGRPLNRFSGALVITALLGQLKAQPLDATLDDVRLPGLAIQSVSQVDPSGWVRVNLLRTAEPMPVEPLQPPVIDPQTQPVAEVGAVQAASVYSEFVDPAQPAVATYPQ